MSNSYHCISSCVDDSVRGAVMVVVVTCFAGLRPRDNAWADGSTQDTSSTLMRCLPGVNLHETLYGNSRFGNVCTFVVPEMSITMIFQLFLYY